ncbi:unnamed protein product [Prunus armeniaca]|uniref:PHD-type domain-containing protein n=1 Tax=Prunus armeniaca TaxID=36596 RepID=A0A6J5V1R3_PRUAR|nr:unnamed protein product [Prunus armeniaca]
MPMVLQSTIPFPDSVEMGKNHLCISVLQSYGIKIVSLHKPCSAQVLGTDSLGGDIQSCKLCGHSENIANMLLCDRCEEAFHVSCCKPRVVLPIDEWFCPSCLKMSQNNSFIKSPSIGSGIGSCKFELGPIAVMLKYPEPYTSKVRLGEAFQAQVPEWWLHCLKSKLMTRIVLLIPIVLILGCDHPALALPVERENKSSHHEWWQTPKIISSPQPQTIHLENIDVENCVCSVLRTGGGGGNRIFASSSQSTLFLACLLALLA